MSGNIFISYRRDDAAAWAGRLHMALERHFRREQIFMDVDSIQPGLDFAKVIDAEVAKCDVMLVVIGKGWLDAADVAGRRRLDDPGDFVRLEVESALRRDTRVVPVLVDGSRLPKSEELPEGMRGLVRRQAWPLSHARFGAESEGLIGEISRYVTPAGGAAAAPARTDWAGEASKLFFYLLGGLCLIAAVTGIGQVGDYLRLGRIPPAYPSTPHELPWVTVAFSAAAWSILAGVVFANANKFRTSKLGALWLTSALGAALLAGLCKEMWQSVAYQAYNNFRDVLMGFGVIAALYVLVSGPALILWRRRKRGN